MHPMVRRTRIPRVQEVHAPTENLPTPWDFRNKRAVSRVLVDEQAYHQCPPGSETPGQKGAAMSQHQPIHVPDFFPGELPAFRVGQVVRHKRYGYRGVIVDFDMACQADAAWYQKNQTQPDRGQPWYHVLVHGAEGTVTYAAQTSLSIDPEPQPVTHPLLVVFFDDFDGVRYERNDVSWPHGT